MKIKALVSAAGEYMIRRGLVYDFPDEVCKDYINAGFAEPFEGERKVVEHGQTASVKQGKRK